MSIPSIIIAIGGVFVPENKLHDYAIRFYQGKDKPRAVLYFQGKRVTKGWRIELVAEDDEDKFGGNANTA